MRGSFDASLEDPWPDRSPDGYRVTHNILRYHQIGVASGWVEVDGSRVEIERRQDLPQTGETERHYLTHKQLLELARATGRFETLTLILGYCGLRFGEPAALRRKDVGNREHCPVISDVCSPSRNPGGWNRDESHARRSSAGTDLESIREAATGRRGRPGISVT
jgi:hypothetical protein